MSINQLHHINYLVADLEKATPYFQALFQQKPILETLTKRRVLTARFDLNGVDFVLVQPISTDGIVAETLVEKGEGVFLISLEVDDLRQASTDLTKMNIDIDETSFRTGLSGWNVCDLTAKNDSRTTIQLCQKS